MKKKYLYLFSIFLLSNSYAFASLKIIIKLDDFQAKNNTCPSVATMDYLVNKNIKAGFGAIANLFDATAASKINTYLNAKDSIGNKLFEVWNHGLDHVNPEFSGTTYEYQKDHLTQSTQLIYNFLGIQMHTIGTPFNASDANTNVVLSEDVNYKVFIFPTISPGSSTGILSLKNRVDMENGTGNPEYSYFVTNYNKYKSSYKDYMVLQGHPNLWSSSKLDQFKLIVDFLISEGCEFVLPYDYYKSLTLKQPTNLTASLVFNNQISLSWIDNSTNESNYIIERSIDGVNWKVIGISAENSTGYVDNTISELISGKVYYRVCANCGIKSAYSNIIQKDLVDGVSMLENQSLKKIYINFFPDKKLINVGFELDVSTFAKCYISGLAGQIELSVLNGIQNGGIQSFSFDTSSLKPGIYFCVFKSSIGSIVDKFIVN